MHLHSWPQLTQPPRFALALSSSITISGILRLWQLMSQPWISSPVGGLSFASGLGTWKRITIGQEFHSILGVFV
jgi:frataxin-like iron-binding protein CyaY